MNIFSQIKILPSLLMNKSSSVFLASNIVTSFLSTDNLVTRFIRVVCQLLYFSAKWIMYIVDVIYFYVLQLAGVGVDTSIFDSASSDMTFNLLISNKEIVTTIIKNLIGIAVVLILVTAIIAIIKQQANALKNGAKKNASKETLKKVFKSTLLIIITPLIAILGIVSSSVILQALFNATNLSKSKSLSARVFNASASAANKYRLYAENGVRIPIVYKFSGNKKDDAINYTANMVGNSAFTDFALFDPNESYKSTYFIDPISGDEIEGKNDKSGRDQWLDDVYYSYYDSSEKYNSSATNGAQYKVLKTHLDEYYAMSDVISYALDTMDEFYFVTVQELLESLAVNNKDYFEALVKSYNIRLLGMESNELYLTPANEPNIENMRDMVKEGGYSYIKYVSKYSTGEYTYVHVKDAVDEIEGAKFIIAYKAETNSEFIKNINGGYYKVADGVFEEADKYYLKESSSSRYKKVDLYYFWDVNKEDYVKAATYEAGKTYYYKIGENYHEITGELSGKFYFKDKDGNYQSVTTDAFYSPTKSYYYMPLLNNTRAEEGSSKFSSEYIKEGFITARGIFDNATYPTAIRQTAKGNIVFYRDDLELVTSGSVSDVGNVDQAEIDEEEEDEEQGFFQKVSSGVKGAFNSVKKFVTDLFNPLKLVPNLQVDESKLATTYTKTTNEIHVMNGGKLHISYFFSDSLTSQLSSKLYGFNLNHLFEPNSINYIILVFGSVMFFKIMVTSVFGLINRSINLFILILIYPVACATIPLDDDSGGSKNTSYKKWSESYTQLLFSTYGLILGLNFVFIILPVIDTIDFFKAEDLANNKALGRLANILFNPQMVLGFKNVKPINYSLVCWFINKILQIIFQLCAFSLITSVSGKGGGDTYYSVIQTVVGTGGGALEDSPLDAVKRTLKTATSVVNFMIFPQKVIKDHIVEGAKKSKDVIKKMVPGSAIKEAAEMKIKQMDAKNADLEKIAEDRAKQLMAEQAKKQSQPPPQQPPPQQSPQQQP